MRAVMAKHAIRTALIRWPSARQSSSKTFHIPTRKICADRDDLTSCAEYRRPEICADRDYLSTPLAKAP
jgi:hypothetical protein